MVLLCVMGTISSISRRVKVLLGNPPPKELLQRLTGVRRLTESFIKIQTKVLWTSQPKSDVSRGD